MKRHLIVMACIVLVLSIASPIYATELSLDYLIGTIVPGSPASPTLEAARANWLINIYNTEPLILSPIVESGYTYDLEFGSNVPDPDLPYMSGGIQISPANIGTTSVSSYDYLMAKFGNNDALFYIAALTGPFDSIAIPANLSGGLGLSHITLFTGGEFPPPPGPPVIPEPSTLLLLGTSLLGLMGLRKFRK